MSEFIVYLEPAEEGGYIVSSPHIPGCVTQGEAVAAALDMIRDAIKGYIFSLKKQGEPVPSGIGD